MMTYEEALTYYDKAALAGSILQRDVMDALLQEIGNPHLDLKYIHIAGTNGKGSCSGQAYAAGGEGSWKGTHGSASRSDASRAQTRGSASRASAPASREAS